MSALSPRVLAGAAAAYAANAGRRLLPWSGKPLECPHEAGLLERWPWKHGTARENLILAMAYLATEIARFEVCSSHCASTAAAA